MKITDNDYPKNWNGKGKHGKKGSNKSSVKEESPVELVAENQSNNDSNTTDREYKGEKRKNKSKHIVKNDAFYRRKMCQLELEIAQKTDQLMILQLGSTNLPEPDLPSNNKMNPNKQFPINIDRKVYVYNEAIGCFFYRYTCLRRSTRIRSPDHRNNNRGSRESPRSARMNRFSEDENFEMRNRGFWRMNATRNHGNVPFDSPSFQPET